MFILKAIGKILLMPVWCALALLWLAVHLAVELFGLFYGLWKLFFTVFIILALGFGMWQNAIVFGTTIIAVFLILFAGTFVEAVVSLTREGVGYMIFSW